MNKLATDRIKRIFYKHYKKAILEILDELIYIQPVSATDEKITWSVEGFGSSRSIQICKEEEWHSIFVGNEFTSEAFFTLEECVLSTSECQKDVHLKCEKLFEKWGDVCSNS